MTSQPDCELVAALKRRFCRCILQKPKISGCLAARKQNKTKLCSLLRDASWQHSRCFFFNNYKFKFVLTHSNVLLVPTSRTHVESFEFRAEGHVQSRRIGD